MARFQIRIDPVWQPLLIVGGAVRSNSYVELRDTEIEISFGLLFRHVIARDNIEGATKIDWPFWMGVGWRTNFRDQTGLIGSYNGVVEMTLKEPLRVWLVNSKRIAISLEDPDVFVAGLG